MVRVIQSYALTALGVRIQLVNITKVCLQRKSLIVVVYLINAMHVVFTAVDHSHTSKHQNGG